MGSDRAALDRFGGGHWFRVAAETGRYIAGGGAGEPGPAEAHAWLECAVAREIADLAALPRPV